MIRMRISETPDVPMKVLEEGDTVRMSVHEGTVHTVVATATYESLPDKPTLNGVTVRGDMSLEDVGIDTIPLAEIAKMFKDW